MKKYIFTESQVKKIIDSQLNEQTMESYEGVVKIQNGKTMVQVTGEMTGNKKTFPVSLKVKVNDGTPVSVEIKNNVVSVWGKDPKNPKGPNIKYN
jgi:hypothetical protein